MTDNVPHIVVSWKTTRNMFWLLDRPMCHIFWLLDRQCATCFGFMTEQRATCFGFMTDQRFTCFGFMTDQRFWPSSPATPYNCSELYLFVPLARCRCSMEQNLNQVRSICFNLIQPIFWQILNKNIWETWIAHTVDDETYRQQEKAIKDMCSWTVHCTPGKSQTKLSTAGEPKSRDRR